MCERVCPGRCVYAVQLAWDPVTCRLRMPEWFPANGNPQTGNTDLPDVHDHRAVCSLRGMVSRTRWMMGMRLMRVMHIMMRIMYIMVRNVVMRIVNPMVGVMNGRMRGMTGHERVRQAERVCVSLITISDSWTAACRHVISRWSPLGRRWELPWRRSSVQWRCRRGWRSFTNFYSRNGAVSGYSTALPRRRFTLKLYRYRSCIESKKLWWNDRTEILVKCTDVYLSTIVLTRLSVIWRRWLDLYRTQRQLVCRWNKDTRNNLSFTFSHRVKEAMYMYTMVVH